MSKFIGWQGFFKILMITLVSSPKQHLPKHMQHSVSVFVQGSKTWQAIPSWSNGLVPSISLDLNAQGGPRNWSDNGHWKMLIGTNTMSQLQQLNSYCFVLRGYKCTRCKCICGGVNHMTSNSLVKLFGTIYKSGSECSPTNTLTSSAFVTPQNCFSSD